LTEKREREEFLREESLMAKRVEFSGGWKKGGERWRREAMTVKPALRRASEALAEKLSWVVVGEFLEVECTAEEMAMIPSVIDAAK